MLQEFYPMNTRDKYREMAVALCYVTSLLTFSYWNTAEASVRWSPPASVQVLDDLDRSLTHVVWLSSDYEHPNAAIAGGDAIGAATLSTESSGGVNNAVIGRSFQISDSVDSQCRHEPSSCSDVLRNLVRLAKEPRDNLWAAEMEKLIQINIAKQEEKQYSIRNIECRTSVCAVEVASIFGPYMVGRDDHLRSSLRPGLATLGVYEADSSGAKVTVTVETFMRR
jgi:hypothetical protein